MRVLAVEDKHAAQSDRRWTIEAIPQGFNTPVLVVTSRVEKESVEAGADDCIFKPFDLGEFIARSRLPIRFLKRNPLHRSYFGK